MIFLHQTSVWLVWLAPNKNDQLHPRKVAGLRPHAPQNNLGELFALLKFLWPDVMAKESEVQPLQLRIGYYKLVQFNDV